MTQVLLHDVRDGVGSIVFNRPEHLNALSADMVEGLLDVTQRFEHDPEVRCVLIQGAGKHFMAGGDVKGFHRALIEDPVGNAAGMEQRVVTGHLAIHRLRRMAKPVVVAVNGAAVGFGLSVVCAADFAIAADDAYFMLAYRHIGLTADGGISYFLPRIVGERRALEIALLGERFSAAQAESWGLLNRVVSAADLDADARAFAIRLAQGPTRALGGAKRLLRGSLQSTWEEQSAREAESIGEMVASADHLEGVTAFIEKRQATFSGG